MANGNTAARIVVEEPMAAAEPLTVMAEQLAEVAPEVLEAVAEVAKPAKPARVCSKCGHVHGNGAGKIRFGRIVEERTDDGTKKFVIAPICDACAEAEKAMPPEERQPIFKIGYLISQVGEMNKQAEIFEGAKGYWARVSQGLETPEVRKTPKSMLSCGVPECPRCHDHTDHAVEHFVVMRIGGKPVIIGICNFQAAALAKSGADLQLFVTKNWGEAKKCLVGEVAKVAAFEAAKSFWEAADVGEAEVEVRVEETEDGDMVYKCGVPGCKCRERGDHLVENYVVLDGKDGMPVAGICRYQFAACKQSAAKFFAAGNGDGMGLLRAEKHRRWLLRQAANAARAISGRPAPRPEQFDRVGGGLGRFRSPEQAAELRDKKRDTRETREARRDKRRANLAAAIGNKKFGNGKRRGGKKGGDSKGGKGKKR